MALKSDERRLRDHTLMLKNVEVLDFRYDGDAEHVVSLGRIVHPELAPPGACAAPGYPTERALSLWLAARAVPDDRFDWDYMGQVQGAGSPAALLFKNLGQGLADQYWFKPTGSAIDWHDVNFFENEFEGDVDGIGPGAATPGSQFKWWECRDGARRLLKLAGDSEREPFAEKAATALFRRLLAEGEYAPCDISFEDYGTCSVSTSIVDEDTHFVPMRDVIRCYAGADFDGGYAECRDLLLKLGIGDARERLAKMIVCDFLGANTGRTFEKFGLIRSSADGSFPRFAPLFGHSRYFYVDADKENDFTAGVYPHASQPFSSFSCEQLSFAEDFGWFDPDALDGFEDELAAILGENDSAPEWFAKSAADQFILQFSHVMEVGF